MSRIPDDVRIATRKSQTIQTHNQINVGANNNSIPNSNPTNHPLVSSTGWIDCDGFDQISMTLVNDAAASSSGNVLWSNDGSTIHGTDQILGTGSGQTRAARTGVKARYAKLQVINGDAATAHVMSAWAYFLS